jgi:hypothetical protein
MYPADIQEFAYLADKNSKYGRKWFFTIISPSDDDIEKLLDVKKDNTLRWLCCYKTVDDMNVPLSTRWINLQTTCT